MVQLSATIFLFVVAALFVWRGVVFGKRYTWIYSAARTVSVVAAILLSLLLATTLAPLLVDTLLTVLSPNVGTFGDLLAEVPTLAAAIDALASMILAPIFFFVFFFILKGILCAISVPVSKLIVRLTKKKSETKQEEVPVAETAEATPAAETTEEAPVAVAEEQATAEEEPKKKKKEKKKKVKRKDALRVEGFNPVGIVLGCVCGLLMFVAIFSPFIGFMTTVDQAMSLVADLADDQMVDMVHDATNGVANNTASMAIKVCGGNAIYNGLTTYRVGEHRVSLKKEMNLIVTAGQAVANMSDTTVTSGEAAYALRRAAVAFDESSLIPTIIPDFLAAANAQWSQGNDFHGIERLSLGEDMEELNDSLLELLATSDYETIKGDVHTVVEILALAVENNALRGEDAEITEILTNETISEGVMLALLDNNHLSPLVGDVLAFGFETLGHSIGAHFDGDPIEFPDIEYASMDDLTIDSSNVQNKAQEAKILSGILRQSFALVESMGGEFDAATCIRDIGPLLDSLASSEIVGQEDTKTFLTCILQAEDVYKTVGFTMKQATDMANTITRDIGTVSASGKVNDYSTLMKTVSSAIKVVQASTNKDVSKETYKETITELMENLTPSSAEVLSQMISTDVMVENGVPEDSAEQTSQLLTSVFTNLANEREAGMSDEDYEREADAIMNMTDLAMNVGSEGTDGAFGEGSATGVEADEFLGNIFNSTVVADVMKEQVFTEDSDEPTMDPLNKDIQLSEEDTADLNAALTERWANEEDKDNEELKKTYQAIGAFIGMEIDFDSADGILKNRTQE